MQALQNGYVTATRGRGVAMDEEKDQRDYSHPQGHMTSMLTGSDAEDVHENEGWAMAVMRGRSVTEDGELGDGVGGSVNDDDPNEFIYLEEDAYRSGSFGS